ncbi:MAG: hypothetical protein U0W40_16305 [Acidimicrobiia bacterium]
MQRSVRISVDTDTRTLEQALTATLDLQRRDDGVWDGPIVGMPDTESRREARFAPDDAGRVQEVQLTAVSDAVVPFFTWFLRIQGHLGARRALPYAEERLQAALQGRAGPPRSARGPSSRRCRSPRSRRVGSVRSPRSRCWRTSRVRCCRRTAAR